MLWENGVWIVSGRSPVFISSWTASYFTSFTIYAINLIEDKNGKSSNVLAKKMYWLLSLSAGRIYQVDLQNCCMHLIAGLPRRKTIQYWSNQISDTSIQCISFMFLFLFMFVLCCMDRDTNMDTDMNTYIATDMDIDICRYVNGHGYRYGHWHGHQSQSSEYVLTKTLFKGYDARSQ